jgi:thiol-disulfide isomerase/thioredoxin
MRHRFDRFAILLAALLSVGGARSAAAQDLGIALGATAPAAVVETLDGRQFDLGTLVGKGPMLIEFWATWCPSCKSLEPQIKSLHQRYGRQLRFVSVAVSVNQSPERVRQYVRRYSIPGDHFYDRRGNATGNYDVPATSYVVIVDAAGKVVYTGVGGDQKLEEGIMRALPAPKR